MIRFYNLPASEEAHANLVKQMISSGYDAEEAHKIVDAAASISIATLRGLDEKIIAASPDETDRTVIQQLVLHQLIGSCERGLEVNAVEHFLKMLMRRR